MRRRQAATNTIDAEENNSRRNQITFNYSESFNRIIELNTENYRGWSRKILYLLSINKLTKYVLKPTIKKLRKKNVKDNLSEYIQDQFDDLFVYEKGTSIEDIENDTTTKWMIINGLDDKTLKLIEGNEKIAYDIWEILRGSFTKGPGKRKLEIENEIKTLKFNIEEDINIFIATLQNLINDLEDIYNELSVNSKLGILNRCLPSDLRWINVFQFDNWEKCCNCVKKVIPEINISNLKETSSNISTNKNIIFNTNKNQRSKQKKSNKHSKEKRKNGRCNYCNKIDHYFYECQLRKKTKFNKRKGFNNYNKDNSKKLKNNYKKGNRNYLNLTQKRDNYNTRYADAFSNDYNTERENEINYINFQSNKNGNHSSVNYITCWIIDSGASVNITNNLNLLTNIRSCHERIYLANNESFIVNYIGTYDGFINDFKITINDVYYSKRVDKNLLSVCKLIQQNYKILFNNSYNKPSVIIYNHAGNRIISINSNNSNTFKLWTSNNKITFNEQFDNTVKQLNNISLNTEEKINL